MKKILLLCLCLTVLTLSLSACQKGASNSAINPEPSTQDIKNNDGNDNTHDADNPEKGNEASPPIAEPLVPDFTLEANNGENVSLSDYAGKVVVLNFWASWCPPCKAEMPEFQKLNAELRDSNEAVLLMLNQTDGQRETKQKAADYLADNGFDFLNLYDSGEVGAAIFGITGIPATVVIDKDRHLSDYVLGKTDYATVSKMIEGAK